MMESPPAEKQTKLGKRQRKADEEKMGEEEQKEKKWKKAMEALEGLVDAHELYAVKNGKLTPCRQAITNSIQTEMLKRQYSDALNRMSNGVAQNIAAICNDDQRRGDTASNQALVLQNEVAAREHTIAILTQQLHQLQEEHKRHGEASKQELEMIRAERTQLKETNGELETKLNDKSDKLSSLIKDYERVMAENTTLKEAAKDRQTIADVNALLARGETVIEALRQGDEKWERMWKRHYAR